MNYENVAKEAAEWALGKVGCAYSQAKRTQPDTFDCSSLVARAYMGFGKQWRFGGPIPRSNQEVYDDDFELLWPDNYEDIGKMFGGKKEIALGNRSGDLQFLCTDSGTKRANRITHVAMVISPLQIVHARGTAYGVCTSSIDLYAGKVCAIARYNPACTLRKGMKGHRTVQLQEALNRQGASLPVDGVFGGDTERALCSYQVKQDLGDTGKADQATLAALGISRPENGGSDSALNPEPVAREIRVTGGSVHIRSGPGTAYSSVGIAHKGDIYRVFDTSSWLPVIHDGKVCWISNKYTETNTEP